MNRSDPRAPPSTVPESALVARPSLLQAKTSSSLWSVRVERVLDSWERHDGYRLTAAERDVLGLACEGLTLVQIAEVRGTALETVLKQSKALLLKTFDDSLQFAAIRLLREAAALP